ncbi:MAG: AraC family transcriptional regulator [Eubacterium sp.]|nr:AraC family transcriptional regulator [Eubacterium sp.]
MKINYIGYHYWHETDFWISRPHGSGDNLLLLLKTPAILNINGKDITVSENSFIIYKEGTPQFYRNAGGVFCNDWVHFSLSESETKMFEALKIPFDTPQYIGDISLFSAMIERMCQEYYSNNMYRSYTEGLYMKLFFTKLGECLQNKSGKQISPHYERMSVIRGRIYSTPQYDWNVTELANELAMSVSYFEHTYKNIFGVSVINEVINSRVEYAKFMLSTTDISVSQVAEMCGYKSDVHFMKQFKSRNGHTPTEYRNKNIKG